jgi:spermidine/putrescine transport system permease protein
VTRARRSRVAGLVQSALAGLVFAFLAIPILVVVVFSFDANRFPTIPWGGFSLAWHAAVLSDPMIISAFWNSVVVATGTALLSTVIGFAAAYVDYRYRFVGKGAMMWLVAVPPAVPVSILGMAMLAFLSRVGFSGHLGAVIACHVAVASSFTTAIIRLKLRDLGADLEHAAWNLGATPVSGILWVVLPFCKPSLIASFFLAAAISFDEFMIAWFVGGVNETIAVRILNLLQGQVNPRINAIGTVALLVSITLVLLAQRAAGFRASQEAK